MARSHTIIFFSLHKFAADISVVRITETNSAEEHDLKKLLILALQLGSYQTRNEVSCNLLT